MRSELRAYLPFTPYAPYCPLSTPYNLSPMTIIPAILTRTSDEAIVQMEALRGTASWIQIDVMDGTMTHSSTFDLYELVGETDGFMVEVHLMTDDPVSYFPACTEIGARRVYFHTESLEGPDDVIAAARRAGFAVGIAVSPQTAIEQIAPYLDEVDAVQIMTVEPGAQGRHFIAEMLEKVEELKADYPDLWVSVDGGVSAATIAAVARAGADAAGVGSAICGATDPVGAYRSLKSRAN